MNELWDEETIDKNLEELYKKSFETKEFQAITNDSKKSNLNENQKIFMDCLEKLEVGTFHKAKFKKFSPNGRKYFVDCFGFDVGTEMSNKELYSWGFMSSDLPRKEWLENIKKMTDKEKIYKLELFEKSLVGKELTVLITVNKNLKVYGISLESLPKISWTTNEYGLHIFCNNSKLKDYLYLQDYEKDKIKQFIKSLEVDRSTKTIYYHAAFAAKDLVLISEDEIKIEPRLLPAMYYEFDSYHPHEYIDPNNPNFIVDGFGKVSSMKYTQMPFYIQSSQAKAMGNLNCLK